MEKRNYPDESERGMKCPIEFTDEKECPIEFTDEKECPIEFDNKLMKSDIGSVKKKTENVEENTKEKYVIRKYIPELKDERYLEDGKSSEAGMTALPKVRTGEKNDKYVNCQDTSKIERRGVPEPEEDRQIVRKARNYMVDFEFSNYYVQPLARKIYINRDGQEQKDKEEIMCNIFIGNYFVSEFKILTRNIKLLNKIVGEQFSAAILSTAKNAAKTVENRFRYETIGIPTIRCFMESGWQTIDGQRVYVHDNLKTFDGISFQTGMSLPSYECPREKVGQIFLDAYGICEDKSVVGGGVAFIFNARCAVSSF